MADDALDPELLRWLDEHRVTALTWASLQLERLGGSPWVLGGVAIVFLLVIVRSRAWRIGAAIALSVYAAGMASDILKDVVGRARPSHHAITHVGGYSMPSSHAAVTVAAATALLLAVRWRSRRVMTVVLIASILALVVIGAAMIYLGAHWLSDVLAGWLLGAVIGAVIGLASRCVPSAKAR